MYITVQLYWINFIHPMLLIKVSSYAAF